MNKTINQYSNPMTINAPELYCLYCNKTSIQFPKPKVFADYISSWTQVCGYDCKNCQGVHYVVEHNYNAEHDYMISKNSLKDNVTTKFQRWDLVTDIVVDIQNDIQIIMPTHSHFDNTRIITKEGKLITSLDPSMTLLLLQYPWTT